MPGVAIAPSETGKLSEYEKSLFPTALRNAYDGLDEPAVDTVPADAGAVTPEPAPEPAPEPSPERKVPSSGDIEAKLAQFERELSELREQKNATERALSETKAELDRLRGESEHGAGVPAAATAVRAEVPTTVHGYQEAYGITEDEGDVGLEVLSAATKIARAEALAAQKRVEDMVKQQLATVGNTVAHAARQAQAEYKRERLRLIPDFDAINNDPAFERWMDGIDVRTRVKRSVLAKAANDAHDAEALAVFFDEYRAAKGLAKPKAKPSVDEQVMPPQRGAGSASTQAPAKKRYTNEQYERETSRAIQLRARDPQAAAALEAELDAALAEGRVGT